MDLYKWPPSPCRRNKTTNTYFYFRTDVGKKYVLLSFHTEWIDRSHSLNILVNEVYLHIKKNSSGK